MEIWCYVTDNIQMFQLGNSLVIGQSTPIATKARTIFVLYKNWIVYYIAYVLLNFFFFLLNF